MYEIVLCCFCRKDFKVDPLELPGQCPHCGEAIDWDWDLDKESFLRTYHWPVPPAKEG